MHGNRVQAFVDYVPIHDESGKCTGVAVIVVDVTELRTTQATLATRLHITELISELSASFIDRAASEVDEGIVGALRALGEGLDIDQTFIAQAVRRSRRHHVHPPVVQSRSSPAAATRRALSGRYLRLGVSSNEGRAGHRRLQPRRCSASRSARISRVSTPTRWC